MKIKKIDFDLNKKQCLEKLYKPDKSRKGDVDKLIMPLIDYLNRLDNFYTTSSCSGRIMLLTSAEKKPDVKWLFVSHEKARFADLMNALKNPPKEVVWLRQENLILHVACRTIDDANKLLKISREIGLRRSGIIADSNIIIVEICSTEKMDVPLSRRETLLVSKEYLKLITKIANEKYLRGREKLDRLFREIKKNLI